jgi:hypothetical protein
MSDPDLPRPLIEHEPESRPPAPSPDQVEVRSEPEPRVVRRGGTPVLLTLVLFAALAGGLYWVWTNPMPQLHPADADAGQIAALSGQVQAVQQGQADLKQALQTQIQGLTARVEKLEQAPQPVPAPESDEQAKQIADLGAKVDALAAKEQSDAQAAQQKPPEAAPAPTPSEPDHAALDALAAQVHNDAQGQVAALSQHIEEALAQEKSAAEQAATQEKVALDQQEQSDQAARKTLAARIQKLEQGEGLVSGEAQKTAHAIRVEQAAVALESGQPLGDIQGAAPALAAYATKPPPTEAGLRAAFPKVAEAAKAASRPEEAKTSFLDRALARLQQSVTVRRGDHVIVGDPAAGIVATAQEDLANGDLAGAVQALSALQGPAAAAVADWVAQAHGLLAARAALANLSAHG